MAKDEPKIRERFQQQPWAWLLCALWMTALASTGETGGEDQVADPLACDDATDPALKRSKLR